MMMVLAILALIVPALCAEIPDQNQQNIVLVPDFSSTFQGQIHDLESMDRRTTSLILRDLNSAHRSRIGVSQTGAFEIYNLALNHKYLLSLDSDTLELPYSYLITPSTTIGDDERKVQFDIRRVSEGRPLSALSSSIAHPLSISGVKRAELVVDRADFSLFKFFTQPTVLLSLGALALATYLPALIADMDPELLEELQKNQIQPGPASEKLQNFDLAKSIADRRANNGKT